MQPLRRHSKHQPKGPVVLVVMDGIGRGAGDEADAVTIAQTPTLDRLWVPGVRCELRAHGKSVGLPSDDDMGNSEVGHNALGAGRVFAQGAKLVNHALATGSIYATPVWQTAVQHGREHTMHFLGLHSDGGVHSNNEHLYQLLERAAQEGVTRARVHVLLDGRDVPARSALDYIAHTEQVSPDMEVPMWIVYFAVPLGSYLMCFRFLQVAWSFNRTGELPHHDHGHVEGIEEQPA